MTTVIKGELEIDSDRGVIYFHAYEGPLQGVSQLRVSNIPTPVPLDKLIDITGGKGQ